MKGNLVTGCNNVDLIDSKGIDFFVNYLLESLSEQFKIDVKKYLIDFHWFDWSKVEFIEGCYTYPSLNLGNSREEA
jgi:hypothetical protein